MTNISFSKQLINTNFQNYLEWLHSLKIGDKVFMANGFIENYQDAYYVKNITKTKIYIQRARGESLYISLRTGQRVNFWGKAERERGHFLHRLEYFSGSQNEEPKKQKRYSLIPFTPELAHVNGKISTTFLNVFVEGKIIHTFQYLNKEHKTCKGFVGLFIKPVSKLCFTVIFNDNGQVLKTTDKNSTIEDFLIVDEDAYHVNLCVYKREQYHIVNFKSPTHISPSIYSREQAVARIHTKNSDTIGFLTYFQPVIED